MSSTEMQYRSRDFCINSICMHTKIMFYIIRSINLCTLYVLCTTYFQIHVCSNISLWILDTCINVRWIYFLISDCLKKHFLVGGCCCCCRFESNCPLVGPGTIGGMLSVGGLSKGSQAVFTRVFEKTTENSERLVRQALTEFESGTSRLPVLSVTTPSLVGQI